MRHTCRRQFGVMTGWRLTRAQNSSSRTEGRPRNTMIEARDAPCSEASFTHAPMTADMTEASNIQRACMGATRVETH